MGERHGCRSGHCGVCLTGRLDKIFPVVAENAERYPTFPIHGVCVDSRLTAIFSFSVTGAVGGDALGGFIDPLFVYKKIIYIQRMEEK